MKWLTVLLVGAVVLIGGLFVVFKFIVQPSASQVKAAAPAPAAGAQAVAPKSKEAEILGGVASLISAAGGAYQQVFGGGSAAD